MKKVLQLIIFLLMIWVTPCYAAVFYGDYYLTKEDIKEYYEDTDTLKGEKYTYYNNYIYEKSPIGYYEEGDNPDNAPYIDYEDYEVDEEIELNYTNQADLQCTVSSINTNSRLRYIKFDGFIYSDDRISYIKIYKDNQEIDYEIIDENFSFNYYVNSSSYLIIDLKEEYYLKDLNVEIGVISINTNILAITFSTYLDIDLEEIYSKSIIITKLGDFTSAIWHFMEPSDFNDFESLIAPGEINYENYRRYYVNYKYRYLYYDLVKKVTDIYTIEPLENHYHDLEDYYHTYSYYERAKIEVADYITNENDDLIIYSNIPVNEIKVISNINLQINNEYDLAIFANDTFIGKTKINVDIPPIKDVITKENIVKETKEKEITSANNNIIKSIKNNEITNQESIIEEDSSITNDSNLLAANYTSLEDNYLKENNHQFLYLLLSIPIILLTIVLIKPKKKN